MFTTKCKKVDELIIAKQFLAAYEKITQLVNDQEVNLTGEQVHYLLNLQSNTKYAAEGQMILKLIDSLAPQPKKGTRISRTDIKKQAFTLGGPFQWTKPELERTVDYIILHDMLPAHIEGDDIVFD